MYCIVGLGKVLLHRKLTKKSCLHKQIRLHKQKSLHKQIREETITLNSDGVHREND